VALKSWGRISLGVWLAFLSLPPGGKSGLENATGVLLEPMIASLIV
jgi:hypothetical protein